MQATKSVVQPCRSKALESILADCLVLTYNAVCYGQKNGIENRKGMKEFYQSLKVVDLPYCFKHAIISRACAVLKSRLKSRKRGVETKHRKPLKPMVCITSGFFVTAKGRLFVPLRKRNEYFDAVLDCYAQRMIQGKELRSLA